MSVQNKRVCIMSRQMVLRRILSNGDDRQADRLAQTLPLRRPEKRPGQFLSLSVHRLPPSSSSLSVCLCLFLFYILLSHFTSSLVVLFQELEEVFFFFYTRCKHSQRLISDLVESSRRSDAWPPVTESTSMASTACCEFKPFISVATTLFLFVPNKKEN